MAEKEYLRLTRARRRMGVVYSPTSSLWLGKDHLLCVQSNGYAETYKRFYFHDIQAITQRRTMHRTVWNIIWGVLAGVFLLVALLFQMNSQSPPSNVEKYFAIVFASIAGLCLLGMLINTLSGPTIVCHLRTAVQTEELPPLNRLRRARKFLERVRPFIVAAQGELPPEEIPARIQAARFQPRREITPSAPIAFSPQGMDDDPNVPPRIVS